MDPSPSVDVFISRKSADAPLAKHICEFLKRWRVFDSGYFPPKLIDAHYQRTANQALETCEHTI